MKDVSIIIVSYNTKEYLRECLASLLSKRSQKIELEIIVVDNASADDSVPVLQKEFPTVFFVKNNQNFGYSKANNIGVRKATGRYILFLNPDTVISVDAVKIMVDFMEQNDHVGVATCRVNLPNGKIDDACHRGFPTPWNALCYFLGLSKIFPKVKFLSGYTLGWMDIQTTHPIDACAGAFMVVRRSAGEMISWWDEDFFWYGEDLDFCYRVKQKGWQIYYIPYTAIIHYKGVSGGIKGISKHRTTATQETKIRATYARFEAMKLFYKKHYLNKYPKILMVIIIRSINLMRRITLQLMK